MPELIVNMFAVAGGSPAIAVGNILGSNIANILLILGLAAVVWPLAVKKGTVWKEIPFSLLAALLLGAMGIMADSYISFVDGIVLLFFFVVFMAYVFVI